MLAPRGKKGGELAFIGHRGQICQMKKLWRGQGREPHGNATVLDATELSLEKVKGVNL